MLMTDNIFIWKEMWIFLLLQVKLSEVYFFVFTVNKATEV